MLKLSRVGAVGFINWLDRSVHSYWFSKLQPKKSNCEKRDSDQKSVRSIRRDPEWPQIAILNNPVNAPSQEDQSGHAASQSPCATPSDPNVKLQRDAKRN